MATEVRFEGGPLDGKIQVLDETPREYIIQFAKPDTSPADYWKAQDPFEPPPMIEIETDRYYRECAEHYWQILTYFWTEEARDKAFAEDTYDPEGPTGMLSACQSAP